MQKAIGCIGFMLVILGITCAGSPSMLLPITMIVSGVVMIGAAAWLEAKWVKE